MKIDRYIIFPRGVDYLFWMLCKLFFILFETMINSCLEMLPQVLFITGIGTDKNKLSYVSMNQKFSQAIFKGLAKQALISKYCR